MMNQMLTSHFFTPILQHTRLKSKTLIVKVIPSHKKGPANDVNNYRPISLLSTFSKLMEKLMAVRLNTYLELHEIIYPNRFGFRSGYSTTHSLITITENIKKLWIEINMDVVYSLI